MTSNDRDLRSPAAPQPLLAAYRSAAGDGPPASVDAALLAAARSQAALVRQRSGSPPAIGRPATGAGGPRWWPGLASVATALVATVLIWRAAPDPLPVAADAARPSASRVVPDPLPSPSSPSPASQRAEQAAPTAAFQAPRPLERPTAPAAPAAPATRDPAPVATAPARPQRDEAAAAAGRRDLARGEALAKNADRNTSPAGAAGAGTDLSRARSTGAAESAASTAAPPAAAQPALADAARAPLPDSPSACIAAFRRLGPPAGAGPAPGAASDPAERRLAAHCRERFPDHRWPDDVAPRLRPPPAR